MSCERQKSGLLGIMKHGSRDSSESSERSDFLPERVSANNNPLPLKGLPRCPPRNEFGSGNVRRTAERARYGSAGS